MGTTTVFIRAPTLLLTYVTLFTPFSLFIWYQNVEVLPVENDFVTWESYILTALSATVLLQ